MFTWYIRSDSNLDSLYLFAGVVNADKAGASLLVIRHDHSLPRVKFNAWQSSRAEKDSLSHGAEEEVNTADPNMGTIASRRWIPRKQGSGGYGFDISSVSEVMKSQRTPRCNLSSMFDWVRFLIQKDQANRIKLTLVKVFQLKYTATKRLSTLVTKTRNNVA